MNGLLHVLIARTWTVALCVSRPQCHARNVTSVQAFSIKSYKQRHACLCGTVYQLLPPHVSFGAIPLTALPTTLTVIQQANERSASASTPRAQDLPFALSVNNNL